MSSSCLLFCFLVVRTVVANFEYPDFNQTAGLSFNGDAGTTNCRGGSFANAYGDYQGKADQFTEAVLTEIGETTVLISESSVNTNDDIFSGPNPLAGFIHRSDTEPSPNQCAVRARLTPSGPSKAGSVWFLDPAPVNNGFDTHFTFQITDHSKQCTVNLDQYFSLMHHQTCSVHGADGFAFVIQNSPVNATTIVGGVGGQMGFGGIKNSLAIAFDTWQNQGSDTVGVDHVSVQSMGQAANDALEAGLLGVPRATPLADGKTHRARITYYGSLQTQYLDKLVASDTLLPYLKDNGEQKRVGTLVVYVDDGIDSDTPLMALPINLSLLLDLPIDKAYVGFTSSTGRFYEKHDILSWWWCDQEPCDLPEKKSFDFHQKSKFTATELRAYEPGGGFGGSDIIGDTFPIKNTSPDTDAWEIPLTSSVTPAGLYNGSTEQVPPNTLY